MTEHNPDTPARPATGRKRDPSREVHLLEATLEVLADVGATGLTMDLVAAKAAAGKATIYRRWTSKNDLMLDAVAHLKRSQVDLTALPDTGTLRGDLLALFRPESDEATRQRLRIMAGLTTLLSQDPTLAEAAHQAVVEPWAEAHFTLMQRAVQRGEVAATVDIHTLSQVLPSMAAYRTLVLRKPFELDFLLSMVDGVLLPALLNPSLPQQ